MLLLFCRRKDCLRQLLAVLCERGELETLVTLPYSDRHVDLQHEVVSILESRARSIDLTKHSYYDLLYSFHVLRGNFRKGRQSFSTLVRNVTFACVVTRLPRAKPVSYAVRRSLLLCYSGQRDV